MTVICAGLLAAAWFEHLRAPNTRAKRNVRRMLRDRYDINPALRR